MADLERSDTFTLDRADTFAYTTPPVTTPYNQMNEDVGILDEEHVNWRVLCTRIFCFFLLFLTIVCCGLEQISPKFLILAAFICALLVLVIISTFIDIRPYLSFFSRPARSRQDSGNSRAVSLLSKASSSARSPASPPPPSPPLSLSAANPMPPPGPSIGTNVGASFSTISHSFNRGSTFTDEAFNPIQI